MYRLSHKEKAEVGQQLVALLDKGFAWPGHSAWGAPVICTAKKTKELQMCVEYHGLNQVFVKHKYLCLTSITCLMGCRKFLSFAVWLSLSVHS